MGEEDRRFVLCEVDQENIDAWVREGNQCVV
jgi:hypothetical protein